MACLGNVGQYKTQWEKYQGCGFHSITDLERWSLLQGKMVAFVGDSQCRNIFLAVARGLGAQVGAYEKHADIDATARNKQSGAETALAFKWRPTLAEVEGAVSELMRAAAKGNQQTHAQAQGKNNSVHRPDAIVISSVLWDTLYVRDKKTYAELLDVLQKRMQTDDGASAPVLFWLSAPTVTDAQLNTADKKKFMTNAQVQVRLERSDSGQESQSQRDEVETHGGNSCVR